MSSTRENIHFFFSFFSLLLFLSLVVRTRKRASAAAAAAAVRGESPSLPLHILTAPTYIPFVRRRRRHARLYMCDHPPALHAKTKNETLITCLIFISP